MAQLLSEEQLTEYRDCFNLYDTEHRGQIPAQDLIKAMRSLGACPTPKEISNYLKTIKKRPVDLIDFSQFIKIMQTQSSNENVKDEIIAALKMTDSTNSDTISVSDLRHILMRTGEKLSAREVDQMFKQANVKGNRVKYRDFVAMVTLPIPDY